MKKLLYILIIVGILLVAGYIAKAEVIEIKNPLQYDDIKKIISAIADLIAVIGSSVAVIMIIWGGIQYMTAGSDETKVKDARKTITWAIIGIAIVWSAKFITDLIEWVLGKQQNL